MSSTRREQYCKGFAVNSWNSRYCFRRSETVLVGEDVRSSFGSADEVRAWSLRTVVL